MLKKKPYFWLLLLLPALIWFPLPLIKGLAGKKLWKRELIYSGYIGTSLLFLSLMFSPMLKLFPKAALFKTLSRYRREIGLSVFFYACFHILAFLLKTYYKKGYIDLRKLLHPVILPGFLAFLVLAILAATSNNASVKKMGGRRWKQLHKLAYAAEGLIFLHILLQDPLWAFLIFMPLALLQGLRIMRTQSLR
jgi:sulfoxide reductase heme-binding subunit YedZ